MCEYSNRKKEYSNMQFDRECNLINNYFWSNCNARYMCLEMVKKKGGGDHECILFHNVITRWSYALHLCVLVCTVCCMGYGCVVCGLQCCNGVDQIAYTYTQNYTEILKRIHHTSLVHNKVFEYICMYTYQLVNYEYM